MAHFIQSFWSTDYAGGLGVLFGKLQQGVQENQQMLTIVRLRADAEEMYGQQMAEIGPETDRIVGGFSADDGASVRKAYDGVRVEMEEAAMKHRKIASNIRELVYFPFSRWCEQHASRVQNSQDDLQGRVKVLDRQAEVVRKLRSHYFNKCRLVEDLEEEDKLAFRSPKLESAPSPKVATPTVRIQVPEEDDTEGVKIGDESYQPDQLRAMLVDMLSNIRLGEAKVPILGTYQNVSTGADIVGYVQKHMKDSSVAYAETVGQDLVTAGFLRLVGNVGSTFANSSRMNYQWKPKAFETSGLPDKKTAARSSTILSSISADTIESPIVGAIVENMGNLTGWNPLNNPHPNETPGEKLRREAREADEKYKAGVRKLDLLRCNLEEAMMEHFKFMERCELDRLRAIKSVILDFSGAISNVIPSLQSTVDKMMLFQETIQPLGDLRYLLENYRTGSFAPKVQIYENYYNSIEGQTFGVDLEARARADKKRVPLIVTGILTHLDNHYPLLDGDESRRAIWLVDVPLAATHRLRNEVNNGKAVPSDVLEKYEVPVVASLLKLYLLELPDALVSSSLYEVVKTIYSNPATAASSASETRVSVLQNTLGQLRLANIVTLDAVISHFARLIDLTSADEAYTASLVQVISPCVLRPRTETSLSFEEKYSLRFLRDLLTYKDAIFGELKRSISLSHSASVMRAASSAAPSRPRATSSDESNRRANMEERARAIASRSRNASPTPSSKDSAVDQYKRRDSSRGPETRFPVHVASGHGGSGSPTREGRDGQQLFVEKQRMVETRFPVNATPPRPRFDALAANGPNRPAVDSLANLDSTPPTDRNLRSLNNRTPASASTSAAPLSATPRYIEDLEQRYPSPSTNQSEDGAHAAPGRSSAELAPTMDQYRHAQSQSLPHGQLLSRPPVPLHEGNAFGISQAPPSSIEVGKSNSLGRSTATSGRYPRRAGGTSAGGGLGKRDETVVAGSGSSAEERPRPVGVELVDKLMDDDE